MSKYLLIIRNTFEEYFIYRLNFVFWRVRNVLGLLTGYFFIQAVFGQGGVVSGYDLKKILTYIFSASVLRAIVFSTKTADLAGIIQSGDLTNFLIKPISTLKIWLAKDLADKILNVGCSVLELGLIIYFVKPPFLVQRNPVYLVLTAFSIAMAVLLYFLISFLLSLIGFWSREVWAPRFIFNILVTFFSGGLIPLDVLPQGIYFFLRLTPFPCLLFNPMMIYLGKVNWQIGIGIILVSLFWVAGFYFIVHHVWQKGLLVYESEGR